METGNANRESQLAAQMVNLSRAAKRYDELVSRLESRAASVLRNAEPLTAGDKPTADPALVPAADELRSTTRIIDAASSRLERVIDRLEN